MTVRDQSKRLRDEVTPLTLDGVSKVPLVVRQVRTPHGTKYALFTEDGRMLAGQGSNAHFVGVEVAVGGELERKESFRASFVIDGENVAFGPPVN